MNKEPGFPQNDPTTDSVKQELRKLLENLELPETIVVTSASAIKVETTKKVLKDLFPKKEFKIAGIKASSKINEQPLNEETLLGAQNRIADAETIAGSTATPRVFVSIENGLFQIGNDAYEDKAIVVIKLPDGRSFSAISPRGVIFPASAIKSTLEKPGGFKDNTVGATLAEMFVAEGKIIDKQDPHSALTDGSFTRETQITSAIEEALRNIAKTI